MALEPTRTHSLFMAGRRIVSGSLAEVAAAAAMVAPQGSGEAALVFSDESGEQVELDLRGGPDAIRERYEDKTAPAGARGRGRPKLGVVAREVTLLPDQWDWLASQPGGASVALRKLVHEARRAGTIRERTRRAQERSYRVMVALAGDLPGFEEAARALFANDADALSRHMNKWPPDIRDHVLRMAEPGDAA